MKTKAKKVSQRIRRAVAGKFGAGVMVAMSALLVGATLIPGMNRPVMADTFQDQIDALNAQNAGTRSLVQGLQAQAASYQDAINQLQGQINGLQAAIDANEAQQASLRQQITDAQNEIERQRAILASDVKAMYVDGTPSTLEMLATSQNLSDFVDKQEYRTSVQQKLQETLKKIAALKAELETKEAQVAQLLDQQHAQQDQLAAARAEQAKLLSYNQSQQANYNAQIAANSKQIAQLRAAQAAANKSLGKNLVAGDPGHGGYPAYLDRAAQDSLVDPWGMYNRECVSYAAWKVDQTYGNMPYWGGIGNANQWPGNAVRYHIPSGRTPRAQSVAIWNVGVYGHAMWVEAVNADGSLWISQYNYDWTGHYSEMYVSASQAATFTYIYFGDY